ncbi:cytochrome b/b6 domain-containing protein [Ramlibacter sp. PS4R-6]|uniref:cytochrome b/b6 domain-containing protein n=1 Tax=Ramlibacter sp. PS4R-6 TaxID=3133438 RepID=UPI0030A99694
MMLTATIDRPAASPGHRVRVWDLPTRIFHWGLAASIVGLFATGYTGGAMMYWHARFGYAVLALLLFRVVWGFVGGRWSRFATFLPTPRRVMRYLSGQDKGGLGHNPLGALSVFAMLAGLSVQVATGLVSDDQIAFTGPLNRFVSEAQGLAATWFHKQVGQWLLAALIVLHIAAIVFYLARRRQNLIQPMIDGDSAPVPLQLPASRDDAQARIGALLVFGVCASAVAWLAKLS